MTRKRAEFRSTCFDRTPACRWSNSCPRCSPPRSGRRASGCDVVPIGDRDGTSGPLIDDPLLAAISEAEDAISSVIDGGPPVQLAPAGLPHPPGAAPTRGAICAGVPQPGPGATPPSGDLARRRRLDFLTGVFIALEGIDGSGKSTIAERLVRRCKPGTRGHPHSGAGWNGNRGADSRGSPRARVVVHASDNGNAAVCRRARSTCRRSHQSRSGRGLIVVTDRFSDSSLAYQWGARGLEKRTVAVRNDLATGGLEPDLKILLDLAGGRLRCGDEWPNRQGPTVWTEKRFSFTLACARRTIFWLRPIRRAGASSTRIAAKMKSGQTCGSPSFRVSFLRKASGPAH